MTWNPFSFFMKQADNNDFHEKTLARVNGYEIWSPHKNVFIVRNSATGLTRWHGCFSEKFQLPDLLKAVEKLPPIQPKHAIVPRPPATEESPE